MWRGSALQRTDPGAVVQTRKSASGSEALWQSAVHGSGASRDIADNEVLLKNVSLRQREFPVNRRSRLTAPNVVRIARRFTDESKPFLERISFTRSPLPILYRQQFGRWQATDSNMASGLPGDCQQKRPAKNIEVATRDQTTAQSHSKLSFAQNLCRASDQSHGRLSMSGQ